MFVEPEGTGSTLVVNLGGTADGARLARRGWYVAALSSLKGRWRDRGATAAAALDPGASTALGRRRGQLGPAHDRTRRAEGLGRFRLVDPHCCRRGFHQWRAAVAAGFGLVVRVEQRLPVRRGQRPVAVMNAVWGESGQSGVSMLTVVLGEEHLDPGPGVIVVVEDDRVVQVVFERFEQRFRKRVVVGHVRP